MSQTRPARAEIYIDRSERGYAAALCYNGALWRGLVQKSPSLQTVESEGRGQEGDIFFGRVIKRLGEKQALVDIGNGEIGFLSANSREASEGKKLLVQIKRPGSGDKGPKLDISIKISSRYLDCIRGTSSGSERAQSSRHKQLLSKLHATGWRGNVREPALLIPEAALLDMAVAQRDILKYIEQKCADAPLGLAKAAPGAIQSLLENTAEVGKIFVSDIHLRRELTDLAEDLMPDISSSISLPREKGDIFANNDIIDQWDAALQKQYHLPNGMNLVFEKLEALSVIDVNVGGGHGNFTNLNKALTGELARQIALRNLGGIILIDLLKMEKRQYQKAVLSGLMAASAYDDNPGRFMGFTKSGLLEVIRSHKGQPLRDWRDVKTSKSERI